MPRCIQDDYYACTLVSPLCYLISLAKAFHTKLFSASTSASFWRGMRIFRVLTLCICARMDKKNPIPTKKIRLNINILMNNKRLRRIVKWLNFFKTHVFLPGTWCWSGRPPGTPCSCCTRRWSVPSVDLKRTNVHGLTVYETTPNWTFLKSYNFSYLSSFSYLFIQVQKKSKKKKIQQILSIIKKEKKSGQIIPEKSATIVHSTWDNNYRFHFNVCTFFWVTI